MITVNKGDIFLVLQHDLETGKSLGSVVCEADICPRGINQPEHAVLTEIKSDGQLGVSVRIFPPHFHDGQIPIVRMVPDQNPVFVESVAKIQR